MSPQPRLPRLACARRHGPVGDRGTARADRHLTRVTAPAAAALLAAHLTVVTGLAVR